MLVRHTLTSINLQKPLFPPKTALLCWCFLFNFHQVNKKDYFFPKMKPHRVASSQPNLHRASRNPFFPPKKALLCYRIPMSITLPKTHFSPPKMKPLCVDLILITKLQKKNISPLFFPHFPPFSPHFPPQPYTPLWLDCVPGNQNFIFLTKNPKILFTTKADFISPLSSPPWFLGLLPESFGEPKLVVFPPKKAAPNIWISASPRPDVSCLPKPRLSV